MTADRRGCHQVLPSLISGRRVQGPLPLWGSVGLPSTRGVSDILGLPGQGLKKSCKVLMETVWAFVEGEASCPE